MLKKTEDRIKDFPEDVAKNANACLHHLAAWQND